VKLVVEEAESSALREMLANDLVQITSALVEVEVVRAVRRAMPELVPEAERVVAQISVVELSETIRARARILDPASLRSLDALHLATALEVGEALDAVVTYDAGMGEAARALGFNVVTPR
jgi:predicted nucleic acid-binding protein